MRDWHKRASGRVRCQNQTSRMKTVQRMYIPIFVLVLGFAPRVVYSQNGMSNTTLSPVLSSTPTAPSVAPSSAPSDITCCYAQSLCDNCTENFKVNSIVYCCPNCVGMVLVTDLLCRCTLPKGIRVSNLKCKLTNTVVGNYLALRPSYYDSGTRVLSASLFGTVAGLSIWVLL